MKIAGLITSLETENVDVAIATFVHNAALALASGASQESAEALYKRRVAELLTAWREARTAPGPQLGAQPRAFLHRSLYEHPSDHQECGPLIGYGQFGSAAPS